jgi:hypothetical protein
MHINRNKVRTSWPSARITVEPTAAPREDAVLPPPLSFEAANHDDIVAIVQRVRANAGLEPDDAASVAIGLKLLGEVVLKQKDNALFDPLRPAIREFVGRLKALNRPAPQPAP